MNDSNIHHDILKSLALNCSGKMKSEAADSLLNLNHMVCIPQLSRSFISTVLSKYTNSCEYDNQISYGL